MARLEYKTTEEYTKRDLWTSAAIHFATAWPTYAGTTVLLEDKGFFDTLLSRQSIEWAVFFTGSMMLYNWYTKMRGKNKNAHNQGELKAAEAPKELEAGRQYDTIEDTVESKEDKVLKL